MQDNYLNSSLILLIENNHADIEQILSVLLSLNCKIDIAENGQSAFEKFKTQTYDLIFMNPKLQAILADNLLKKMRAWEFKMYQSPVPIVALITATDTANKIPADMDAIVFKPVERKIALGILSALIPHRSGYAFRQFEKIVDFEQAILFSNKDICFAENCLKTLIEHLPHYLDLLKIAYQNKNWHEIKMISHKIRGGIHYSGAFRLGRACYDMDSGVEKIASRQRLYRALLTEIYALQDYYTQKQKIENNV